MTDCLLQPVPLVKDNFSDFDDLTEIDSQTQGREINYSMTQRYHNPANFDLQENDGQPLFNIFYSKAVVLPFKVKVIERHPLSSQLFYPLSTRPFLVLVAKPSRQPTADDQWLFITNSYQGINFNKNTWHHYLLVLNQSASFIVVDRGGTEKNCNENFFDDTILIEQV